MSLVVVYFAPNRTLDQARCPGTKCPHTQCPATFRCGGVSVCVLCGSPVWPSPPVVGPLWGLPLHDWIASGVFEEGANRACAGAAESLQYFTYIHTSSRHALRPLLRGCLKPHPYVLGCSVTCNLVTSQQVTFPVTGYITGCIQYTAKI